MRKALGEPFTKEFFLKTKHERISAMAAKNKAVKSVPKTRAPRRSSTRGKPTPKALDAKLEPPTGFRLALAEFLNDYRRMKLEDGSWPNDDCRMKLEHDSWAESHFEPRYGSSHPRPSAEQIDERVHRVASMAVEAFSLPGGDPWAGKRLSDWASRFYRSRRAPGQYQSLRDDTDGPLADLGDFIRSARYVASYQCGPERSVLWLKAVAVLDMVHGSLQKHVSLEKANELYNKPVNMCLLTFASRAA
jgi:hypothetical protein